MEGVGSKPMCDTQTPQSSCTLSSSCLPYPGLRDREVCLAGWGGDGSLRTGLDAFGSTEGCRHSPAKLINTLF